MMYETVERLRTLSDTQILDGLQNAMRTECRSTATLVAHIAEVDARRLYLERAKPSMFSYCVESLGLSEQAAYLRINAARLARRFPKALDGLAAGRLHLTALKLVGPHLTDENSGAVLERVGGKSRRAIEVELARLFPREDAPNQLRKLPTERGEECEVRDDHPSFGLFGDSNTPQVQTTAPASASERPGSEPSASASVPPFKPHRPSDVSRCTALSGSRYRLQVTLPERTRAKLDVARDLLRHQVPDGDLASVLDHALDALIEVRMRRKFAKTSRPRRDARHSTSTPVVSHADVRGRAGPRSRHIPNAIKRAVVDRDGMRCSYVDEQGERCTATSPLEFHHHDPFAKGGAHSVSNVSLVCRAHNGHAARRDYGRMMERYQKPPGRVRERRAHYRAVSSNTLPPSSSNVVTDPGRRERVRIAGILECPADEQIADVATREVGNSVERGEHVFDHDDSAAAFSRAAISIIASKARLALAASGEVVSSINRRGVHAVHMGVRKSSSIEGGGPRSLAVVEPKTGNKIRHTSAPFAAPCATPKAQIRSHPAHDRCLIVCAKLEERASRRDSGRGSCAGPSFRRARRRSDDTAARC